MRASSNAPAASRDAVLYWPSSSRGVVDDPDPATAPAAGRLERNRIADLVGHRARLAGVGDRPVAARDRRHAAVLGRLARAGLVAHQRDVLGLGTDERAGRRPRPRTRSPRARRGSRSPGAPPRPRCSWPPRRSRSCRGRTCPAGGGPTSTAASAMRTCGASESAVLYTATASIPRSWAARMIRTAISPRLATRTRFIRRRRPPRRAGRQTRRPRCRRGTSTGCRPSRPRPPGSSS